MFRKKQGGPPDRPLSHSDTCKMVKADPGVDIPWAQLETGHWVATCVCGSEHYYAPALKRTRVDPLDPATSRHGGACEFKETTDRAVLRALLRVRPGLEEGYSWVECGACGFAWPVPDFAETPRKPWEHEAEVHDGRAP
jgi:hypothetical protein